MVGSTTTNHLSNVKIGTVSRAVPDIPTQADPPALTRLQRFRYWLTFPVIASLLRMRAMCVGLVGFLGLQLGLSAVGIPFMGCAMLDTTGVPCPGCGMTRGAIATAQLDLDAVLYYNVFGPFALAATGLMFLGAILPNRQRMVLAAAVETIERKTALTNFCFLLLWVYWLARLAILGRELGVRLTTTSL